MMFEKTSDFFRHISLGENSVLELKYDEQVVPDSTSDDFNAKLWKRFKTVLSSNDDR